MLRVAIRWTFIAGIVFLVIGIFLLLDGQTAKDYDLSQLRSRLTKEEYENGKIVDFHLWIQHCEKEGKGYTGNWQCD
jgi:hypothetical protein